MPELPNAVYTFRCSACDATAPIECKVSQYNGETVQTQNPKPPDGWRYIGNWYCDKHKAHFKTQLVIDGEVKEEHIQ